jgi:hypothetical protein
MRDRYPPGVPPKRSCSIGGFRSRRDRATLPDMKRLLFWITLGAAIAWFADPVSGAQRRRAVEGLVNRSSGGGSAPSSSGI